MPVRRRYRAVKDIQFISLCPRGANGLTTILKDDGAFEFEMIAKQTSDFMQNGEMVCCMYAPELRDSHGDIADAEICKQMAHAWARDGKGIDFRHDNKVLPKGSALVAESFIIQKNDPRYENFKNYSGEVVDVTGGWGVVLKIEDQGLRKLYGEQGWNGVSLQGHVLAEVEKSEEIDESRARSFITSLMKMLGISSESKPEGDRDMKPEEVTKIVKDANTELLTGLKDIFTEAGILKAPKKDEPVKKEETPAKPTAPKFTGNPLNAEEVRKHQDALKAFKASESVDWSDPVAVEKHLASISATPEEEAAIAKAAGITDQDSPQVRELKKQLVLAQRESNQVVAAGDGTTPVKKSGGSSLVGVTKADDCVAAGNRMAAFINGK